MKKFKKLAALILAVVMVLSMTVMANAADDETVTGPYTVTINNATGHDYKIYQIFTGDLSTKKNEQNETVEVLANIKYGTDYIPEGKELGDDAEIPENFDPTTIVPTGEGTLMTVEGTTVKATGLVAGYYMIVDVTDEEELPDGEALSAVIFQVVGDTVIASKHPTTTIIKKVQDINDTTGEYTTTTAGEYTQNPADDDTWIDSADYDINDVVPFKSTATFDGLVNYDNYRVVFTDTMAEGLTYNGSMTVTIYYDDAEGNEISTVITSADVSTATYAGNDTAYTNGTVITVDIENIKPIIGESNSATIVLEYTATLNEKAKLGAPGNPNKIQVSTKPDGSGETPEDVNIVFTFRVDVDKYTTVDKEKVGLPNAGFTLYKEVADGETEGAELGSEIKADLIAENASIKAEALDDDSYYIIAAEVEVDEDGDTFGFNGIDDGTYVLVETTIPAGYNAWEAEEFEVEASHELEAEAPALTSLSGGEMFTGTVNTGILKGEVENKTGTVLPETGGIGTTIFYAVGGIMVLAAIILLVTKKRMASAD